MLVPHVSFGYLLGAIGKGYRGILDMVRKIPYRVIVHLCGHLDRFRCRPQRILHVIHRRLHIQRFVWTLPPEKEIRNHQAGGNKGNYIVPIVHDFSFFDFNDLPVA
jgi:hypothetical protein